MDEVSIIMASIEVDLGFFIFSVIMLFFLTPLVFGILVWKSYRNPEWWLKFRRQDYVYAFFRNPVGRRICFVLPLRNIKEDESFIAFKDRKYFWKKTMDKKDENGKVLATYNTLSTWKGKASADYEWNDPMPQAIVPGNSLTSLTDPKVLKSMNEMKILQLLMNADSMTQLMQAALVISVIGLLIVGGLAFTVFNVSGSVSHLSCILSAQNSNQGNATLQSLAVAACH